LSGNEKESRTVREKLDKKIDSYAAGKLEHAVDTISSIWEVSNEETEDPSTSIAPSKGLKALFPNTTLIGFSGYDLRPSLIKSIQEASLLDRKYWARRSREGKIEPVYFPNTVPETDLRDLDTYEPSRSGENARY